MPATGDVIEDKYRLIRQIGEGGMATVWEAEHLRLETRVAVKFLAGLHFGKEADRARFLGEARAAAAIHHRNVIDIVDFGTTKDDTPFMVMELLSGETLADRIDEEAPMPVEQAVEITVQILGALVAVHDAGIIHRDLKPENVMFARDADGTLPKLADFGISKNVAEDPSTSKRPKTREGLLLGTPQYMSPEQARALSTIDHRADIYAVGVMLYEMLTGTRPYESESVVEVLSSVLDGSARPVDQVRPDLPASVADVVMRAMAPEAALRFGDAREMRAALLEAIKNPEPRRPASATAPTERPPAPAMPLETPRTEPAKPVELPDPKPIPLPTPEGARLRWAIIALVALATLFALPEILSPGFYRDLVASGRAATGADIPLEIAMPSDAGVVEQVDAGVILVRLRGVPMDAVVLVDEVPIDAASLELMRTADGTLEIPMAMRADRFLLSVQAPGFREWRIRRRARRDYTFRVRLRPEPAPQP